MASLSSTTGGTGGGPGGGYGLAGSWGRSGYDPSSMGIQSSLGRGFGTTRGSSALSDPRVSRFTPSQRRGILGSGLGEMMMGSSAGDVEAYYKQLDYEKRQRSNQMEALGRIAGEQVVAAEIEKSPYDAPTKDKIMDYAKAGRLDKLRSYNINTEPMEKYHHAGGILGGMFGYGKAGDDVQTMSEVADELTSSGLAVVNPDTGMLEKPVIGSLWDALTTGVAVPAGMGAYFASKIAPAKVAEAVMDEDISRLGPAVVAGGLTKAALSGVASHYQPSDFGIDVDVDYGEGKLAGFGERLTEKALSMAPAMAINLAAPGLGTPIGMVSGMIGRAADLDYGGVPGWDRAPSAGFRDIFGSEPEKRVESITRDDINAAQQQAGMLGYPPFGRLFTQRFENDIPFSWGF